MMPWIQQYKTIINICNIMYVSSFFFKWIYNKFYRRQLRIIVAQIPITWLSSWSLQMIINYAPTIFISIMLAIILFSFRKNLLYDTKAVLFKIIINIYYPN